VGENDQIRPTVSDSVRFKGILMKKNDILKFLGFQLGIFKLEWHFILPNIPKNWFKKCQYLF